jgi:hypothetical protein
MENKEFFERETKGFSESEAGGDTWMSGALPTPSVQNAIERLQSLGGDVSAAAFAREVLKGHSDYARYRPSLTGIVFKRFPCPSNPRTCTVAS